MFQIELSEKTKQDMFLRDEVDKFYRRGLEMVEGGTLFGYKVNVNNPKEVIACLYLLADDYRRFHERW